MGEGIGKAAGKHQLLGPEIGWGADGRLQWTALAVVIGIIEDRVGGADQPSRVAGGIPGNPDARRKSLLLGRNQAGGNARISGIKQADRSIRPHPRLCAGFKQILPVTYLGVREGKFVAQAEIQRQM